MTPKHITIVYSLNAGHVFPTHVYDSVVRKKCNFQHMLSSLEMIWKLIGENLPGNVHPNSLRVDCMVRLGNHHGRGIDLKYVFVWRTSLEG
jgi:hypothetical protein